MYSRLFRLSITLHEEQRLSGALYFSGYFLLGHTLGDQVSHLYLCSKKSSGFTLLRYKDPKYAHINLLLSKFRYIQAKQAIGILMLKQLN